MRIMERRQRLLGALFISFFPNLFLSFRQNLCLDKLAQVMTKYERKTNLRSACPQYKCLHVSIIQDTDSTFLRIGYFEPNIRGY